MHDEANRLRQINTLLVFTLPVAFIAFILTNHLLVFRRILRSISNLRDGTRVIGSGNFDFFIEAGKGDEIGELADAFNQMTSSLKAVTASKAELEQEIDRRRQDEDEMRQTRDYMDNLINYANAPIIVWDPGYRITRFNRAFEHLTGYGACEVHGRSLEILFPDDRKEASMALIHRTTHGERWEVVEIPIAHADGSIRKVLWNSATLYGPDGATVIATIAQGQTSPNGSGWRMPSGRTRGATATLQKGCARWTCASRRSASTRYSTTART